MNKLKLLLSAGAVMLSAVVSAQFSFTTNAGSQCAPAVVSFDNTSTSGVHFNWDFGDGTTVNDVTNPTHSYQYGGNYWVTMWAYDASNNYLGQTNQQVNLSGAPENLYLNPSIACPNDVVNMQLYVQGGSNYAWDFDDGQSSFGDYVQHSYTTPGEYHPTVTFDIAGCGTYSITDTITITNTLPYFSQNPTYLSLNPSAVCPGDIVYGSTQNIYSSYNWDFGDGNSASGEYVDWSYSSNGNYNVVLTVTNGCGVDTSLTDVVVVSNTTPVQNASTYLPDTVCPG